MALNVPQGNLAELVKIARLDVATDGTTGSYSWVEVPGLKSLTDSNSYTTQDTSYFGGGPRGTDTITQVKQVISGTLQKFVADSAAHALIKSAGLGNTTTGGFDALAFRMYARNGQGQCQEFTAQVQWEPQGGSTTDLKTNNFSLIVQETEFVANPLSTVPTLTSALPASKTTGDWIEVIGNGFDRVVGVTVGGTAATYLLINSRTLHVKLPAGSAGSAPIVVTNQAGASTSLSYTRT